MLADLLGHPGVEEVYELRSRFGFLAIHGGSLEQGTDSWPPRRPTRAGASSMRSASPTT